MKQNFTVRQGAVGGLEALLNVTGEREPIHRNLTGCAVAARWPGFVGDAGCTRACGARFFTGSGFIQIRSQLHRRP
jgi:hypothetical protein